MSVSEGELLRNQLADTIGSGVAGFLATPASLRAPRSQRNELLAAADALLARFDVRLRVPQEEAPANAGERHAVEALLRLMRTPREERVMPPADDTNALTERLHASVIEVFRKALMVERHDDWTMETVSDAAHICAAAYMATLHGVMSTPRVPQAEETP